MDDRVFSIAEDMFFHYTNKSIESLQLIPYYTSDGHVVKNFIFDHAKIKVGYVDIETGIEDKRIAIRTNSIRSCLHLRSKLSEYKSRNIINGITMQTLVEDHTIHPFLLFLKGRFVKWSDIKIYKDLKYCFLIIDSDIEYQTEKEPLLDSDIQILQLPMQNLIYTEKQEFDKEKTLIFAFDYEGYLNISGTTYIYMDQSIVGYIQLLLPGGNILEDDIQVPDECQLYPNNIIVFKDNKLYPNPKITISPYNTMTIDDGTTTGLEYKMFYDKTSNLPYNNVSSIVNHNYLKNTYLNTEPNPDWLNILHEKFDFSFDSDKSYEENINSFAEYMKRYNYKELINKIKSDNVYVVHGVIGDLSIKINHCFAYPKEYNNSNLGCMLFINGILSNSAIKRYQSYGVIIDIDKYTDDSTYEFIVYNNKLCDVLWTNIMEDPDYLYFTNNIKDGSFDLYCSKSPESIFDLEKEKALQTDHVKYKIDPSHYTKESNSIKFNDFYNTLVDEIIYKVPRAKFVYEKFIINNTRDYNVHLTNTDYSFCDDKNKYMVFLNGYRLHSSLYRVIIPSPTTPFNDQAIYFSIILNKDDIVEVFYTPMSILDEVYIDDLNHSSVTTTGVDQLGYITGPKDYGVPLTKKLQFFFVNGIKIPYEYLMDISYNMTRIIVNLKTIDELCIIGYDSELINFFKELKLTDSKLDTVYNAHDKMGINILTNTFTSVSNINSHKEKEIDDHALINEIVRYYYGYINKGVPFRYDYDSSVYAEVDSRGNIIIDVMDATKNVNLVLDDDK